MYIHLNWRNIGCSNNTQIIVVGEEIGRRNNIKMSLVFSSVHKIIKSVIRR